MSKYKELKKLATSCRKLGISHYKCAEFEFTLTPESPLKVDKKAKKLNQDSFQNALDQEILSTDTLTQDQLLFWSAGDGGSINEGN